RILRCSYPEQEHPCGVCACSQPIFGWCEEHARGLKDIDSVFVAMYVELLFKDGRSKPRVKQHLAAIRMLLDWMVTGGVLPFSPASSVRGPKYVVKKGKTPVLKPRGSQSAAGFHRCFGIIGPARSSVFGIMVYSFARVSAVVGMNVERFA